MRATRSASKTTSLPDLVEENESELPKVDSDQPILVNSLKRLKNPKKEVINYLCINLGCRSRIVPKY